MNHWIEGSLMLLTLVKFLFPLFHQWCSAFVQKAIQPHSLSDCMHLFTSTSSTFMEPKQIFCPCKGWGMIVFYCAYIRLEASHYYFQSTCTDYGALTKLHFILSYFFEQLPRTYLWTTTSYVRDKRMFIMHCLDNIYLKVYLNAIILMFSLKREKKVC